MLTRQQLFVRRIHDYEAADVIDAVFDAMSEESKRLRFLTPMPKLPPSVRRQLADLRGSSHAAFGAWVEGNPVGFGQLARLSRHEAEIAVAVADGFQNRGIGRRLLRELAELAAGLGYRSVSADVLVENTPMMHLMYEVFPGARLSQSRGVVHVVSPVEQGTHTPIERRIPHLWNRALVSSRPRMDNALRMPAQRGGG